MSRPVEIGLDSIRLRLAKPGPAADGAQPRSLALLRQSLGRPLKVVVVRLDGIGDWILSLPLIDALTRSPDVQGVSIVAPSSHESLLHRSSDVGFIAYDAGTILDPPRAPLRVLGKLRAVSWLTQKAALERGRAHAGEFDLAILPRWDSDIGLNARAWAVGAGAPIAAHDPACLPHVARKERAERALIAFPTQDQGSANHEVEHLQILMKDLGVDPVVPQGYGLDFFGVRGVRDEAGDQGKYVVLHTSSNEPKREWPVPAWRAVISALMNQTDRRVVLVGAPSEVPRHAEIMAGLGDGVSSVAQTSPLGALPRLLAGAYSLIGNDSGPAHVAASLNVPVVVVSPHPADGDPAHRNSPARFGPWSPFAEVVRPVTALPPCRDSCVALRPHCITQVTRGQVLEAHEKAVARAYGTGTAGGLIGC